MRWTKLEMMRDHVRAIHRAVTGIDPPESAPRTEDAAAPTPDELTERFAELESLARSLRPIAERVPPYSYAPPLDVIGTERELIFELGMPGVARVDIDVEVAGGVLIVSGARSATQAADGRIYLHAELPRGPFHREIRLPEPTTGAPRFEVEDGVLRVRLTKTSKSSLPRA